MLILIIDDDAAVRSSLSLLLKKAGHEVALAAAAQDALAYVRQTVPDLMLMDMNFSLSVKGEEGLELLMKMKILCPAVPVILITGWGSIELAVKGMKAGAFDFVTKPWDNRQLLNLIDTAFELNAKTVNDDIPKTRKELDSKYDFSFIVGQSDELIHVLATVARIADTNASVLITGESGTGKELIAEAIHKNSRRKRNRFVKVNLGGISQTLFESEMFGHKKGAFTDAQTDRTGRFETADNGTIFLDEIGELDLASQVKLLRVLQDQTFEVLGDSRTHKVDVRVISATNANLAQLVKEKKFREDLLYRINLIHIHLPALRERKKDIPVLAKFFAEKQATQNHLSQIHFTPESLDLLEKLPYPGNIRELKNLIDRTILMSGKTRIEPKDIQMQLSNSDEISPLHVSHGTKLEDVENQSILKSIQIHNGNLSNVAKELGISRAALYRRMEKYGIRRL